LYFLRKNKVTRSTLPRKKLLNQLKNITNRTFRWFLIVIVLFLIID